MTDLDFKNSVSEYIDILTDHCVQVAKDMGQPTSEMDMLKIIEVLVKLKIEGVE